MAVPPAHLACWDLRVAGDVLYVGGAQGIGVVDVADPTLPVWLGWTELPTHDIVNDIVLADGYLYAGSIVTDWEGTGSVAHRLDVFSLADPLAPELVWRSAELGGVGELLVFGDTAFLAAGGEGVLVWDVGDPTHPELQGAIATSGSPRGLAVSGEYLLAAQGGGGLLPIHVGALPAP